MNATGKEMYSPGATLNFANPENEDEQNPRGIPHPIFFAICRGMKRMGVSDWRFPLEVVFCSV
jgi:hypothetical protein